MRAKPFESLGKYVKAIQAFDEAIRLDPKDANGWYGKGLALKAPGRTTEADAAFTRAKDLEAAGPAS